MHASQGHVEAELVSSCTCMYMCVAETGVGVVEACADNKRYIQHGTVE